MIANADAREYWEKRSGSWRASPPFTPGEEDVAWFARTLGLAAAPQLDALILGVTPELARLPWPAATRLHAVDQSPGMMRNVWSPRAGLDAAGVCADWHAIPLADASKDAAVSDGCYTALGSFDDSARVNAELARVLRPGSIVCVRSFVRPDRTEDVERLFAELRERGAADANLFRWRLAAAVQAGSRGGVALDEVWRCWQEHAAQGDPAIERWRGVRMRYWFPTVGELESLAAPHFRVMVSERPGYPGWGERLHRIAFRK